MDRPYSIRYYRQVHIDRQLMHHLVQVVHSPYLQQLQQQAPELVENLVVDATILFCFEDQFVVVPQNTLALVLLIRRYHHHAPRVLIDLLCALVLRLHSYYILLLEKCRHSVVIQNLAAQFFLHFGVNHQLHIIISLQLFEHLPQIFTGHLLLVKFGLFAKHFVYSVYKPAINLFKGLKLAVALLSQSDEQILGFKRDNNCAILKNRFIYCLFFLSLLAPLCLYRAV